jgi:putative ABC transport system permease protein
MESLARDNDLEVVASGGVPESVLATLATQPYPLRISPRIEDFAVDTHTRETLPLIGLDLIAEGSRYASLPDSDAANSNRRETMEESVRDLENPASVWVSAGMGKQPGEHISLLINDRVLDCLVRGVIPTASENKNAILMDIAGAQRALHRFGRVDRILIKLPANSNLEKWREQLSGVLPPGVEVRPQGAGTEENRKMLAAFRWNLRLLSYIALVVGAFLIYNTISVSVVRRRNEI